jgi:hypothetical protein
MVRRPATSSAGRTAVTAGGEAPTFDRDPQYTYDGEGDYLDEEESEDEDVFAFLPPSTADQAADAATSPAHTSETLHETLQDTLQHPTSNEPIFTHAPMPPSPKHSFDTNRQQPAPSNPTIHSPPQSPPSTESRSQAVSEPPSENPNANSYRLHRVNNSKIADDIPFDLPELPWTSPTSLSKDTEKYGGDVKSQSAPAGSVSAKEFQARRALPLRGKTDDSMVDSVSMTPSMMEEESQTGSIK